MELVKPCKSIKISKEMCLQNKQLNSLKKVDRRKRPDDF
jgi:hypothetical protein